VALVFVGSSEVWEGENADRRSLSLPPGQDALVAKIAAENPNTVVVINSGGSVLMPWLSQVAGVVQAWYPGQEGGHALADSLLGNRNFSGKLPVSFYAAPEHASSYGNYAGENGRVTYAEGIFLGYRHLDTRNIEPLFAFGHGLSYSEFAFEQISLRAHSQATKNPRISVYVRLKNTSARTGAEVVQVYVHAKKPRVERPEQELKGFRKVWLKPGETKSVRIDLPASAFAYYDIAAHAWRVDPGAFEIRVGNSSRSLPLKRQVQLQGSPAFLKE